MNPSSPVSDTSKSASRPGLSKKAKFWLGLSLAVIIPVIVALAAYGIYLSLFPNNPRLVVKRILLAGYFSNGEKSSYWNPADENEQQARIEDICKKLDIEIRDGQVIGEKRTVDQDRDGTSSMEQVPVKKLQLFSNEKKYELAAMSEKLRTEIPELERVNVRRVIPDQLVFRLIAREPIANLNGNKGKDSSDKDIEHFYIGKDGTVLSRTVYRETSLPTIICNPAAVRTVEDPSPFKRGEKLSTPGIRTALDFIRLVRLRYPDIKVLHVVYLVKDEKYIQCDIQYKDDPGVFNVLIPVQLRQNEELFRKDIFGRLIPLLEESYRNKDTERSLDLRFDNRVIGKKQK